MSKKLINQPEAVVSEMLRGLVATNPALAYDEGFEVVYRAQKSGNVGVLSGGGAGHEPAHAGYVGHGMLDAAVSGNVFASPGPDRILDGIRRADNGKGVLIVLKNYSGDIMNFQMATELAEMENIQVSTVVVKDDVAVPDSLYSAGRRGIAGTVFVHKIAGAAAAEGKTLAEVAAAAQKTIDNVRSMGMASSPCTLPGAAQPNFCLAAQEVEIGMGIHGEPGVNREIITPAAALADKLLARVLEDYNYKDSEVAVLVNGLGGTPLMELYIMFGEVKRLLAEKGISVYKALVGNYMTSLEMAGCSVTLLKLDSELKRYLDAPCDTTAWKVL